MPITPERLKQKDAWDREHTLQFKLKFMKTTDADIIEMLQSVPNRQGYIKSLIRADIERRKSE